MNKRRVISVDLGGTYIRTALVEGKKIFNYEKIAIPKTKKQILQTLIKHISQFYNPSIRGIGVASPGPLKNGIIKLTPNLPFKNFNLKKFLEKKFNILVRVENDANCVALAEAKYGVKKNNFFILTLGTGIGGGIIINKKLYDSYGMGNELGHIYLTKEKTFEDLASGKAIEKQTKKIFGKKILINDLIKMKDRKAISLVDKITTYYGQAIGSLINILNPEIIVLAGGMKKAGKPFIKLINKKTKKYTLLPKKYDIVWTKLSHPGILGASLLIN